MVRATRQADGTCFEFFRRVHVFARREIDAFPARAPEVDAPAGEPAGTADEEEPSHSAGQDEGEVERGARGVAPLAR